jgi:MFS family permease
MAAPNRGGALAVTVLCSVQFVDVLGVTVVVTALPRMLADLNAPASAGSLISGGYAMFFGGLLMLGARLGDRFGHRRTILASLAVFAAGALLGAVANSVVALTAARCLQGAAAAGSVPSALRLLTTLTPPGPVRRRAIAAWSAAGASAGASGFVVGGIVTDLASWRFVFWAYLPLSAAITVAMLRSVPRDAPGQGAPGSVRQLNLVPAALFTAAVMAVVVGTTMIAQPGDRLAGAGIVALAVPLAVTFVRADRRAAAPLLPAAVLGIPALRRGTLGAFLNTAATSSAMTLATLYLQGALHRSPLEAAAMLLPFSLAVVAGSALSAPALRRMRPRLAMAAGLAAVAAADAALIAAATRGWLLSVCVAAAGAGLGLSSVAATAEGTDVPPAARGTASGIINTAAQIGTALGIAVLLLIAAATTGPPVPGTQVPVVAWATAAAIAAAGALAFAIRPRPAPAQAGQARSDTGPRTNIVPLRGARPRAAPFPVDVAPW